MCVALVGYIYPILVLILLLRPTAAAAFRRKRVRSRDYDDRYDHGGREDDYRKRRRGYEEDLPGYGREPDDRFGPAR
jgi:hypothetical protein